MNIGDQIKKFRVNQGLTQDKLAEDIYVTRQSLSSWENNKSFPDINSLVRLSKVFDVTVDDLIKGEPELTNLKISNEERLRFQAISILLFLTSI